MISFQLTFSNRSGEKVPYTFHRKGLMYTNCGGEVVQEWSPDHPYYLRNIIVTGNFESGLFEFDIFQGEVMTPILSFNFEMDSNIVTKTFKKDLKNDFILEANKPVKIYQHTDLRYSEIRLTVEKLSNTVAFMYE